MLKFSEVQLHTLRTGHIPDTLPSLRSLHQSISHHIADLQDQLALKQVELQYCSALLSPIRRLPRELLLCIFHLANEGEILQWQSSRIVIGRVCQQWRSVSRSFPSLWSHIVIQVSFHWHGDRTKSRLDPRYSPAVKKELIELCLVQSHPRPLDIVLDLNAVVPTNVEHVQYLDENFRALCSYASRWRSFECVGQTPELFDGSSELPAFDFGAKLAHTHLNTLESLDTMFISRFRQSTKSPIHVPSLRSLRTTLSNATFISKWTHLTIYIGPFRSPKALVKFLSRASNLTSLYITHLDSNRSQAQGVVPPIIHNTLRVLKLNECAISLVLVSLTFPLLEEFIMPTLDDWRFTHPVDCARGSVDDIRYMHLEAFIQRSCCPIHVLELGSANYAVSLCQLMKAFRSCERTLARLRVYLPSMSDETIPVLEALTIRDTTQTIFPNLAELEIETNTERDMLFVRNHLEDMLRSRCDVESGGTLKRLRLERDVKGMVMVDYATSALSSYLQELQDRGIDVEWSMCQDDMLEETKRLRDYLIHRTRIHNDIIAV